MTPLAADRLDRSSAQSELEVPQSTLSQRNRTKLVRRGAGAAYWGPGELMTFLVTGAETDGTLLPPA